MVCLKKCSPYLGLLECLEDVRYPVKGCEVVETEKYLRRFVGGKEAYCFSGAWHGGCI